MRHGQRIDSVVISMIPDPQLGEFEKRQKTYLGKRRTVYYLGKDGPGVVLMEEVPGITPHVLGLAKLLTENGFRVAIPSLFGTDGAEKNPLRTAATLVKVCVSREFAVFARNGSSPIVDWIRELCRELAAETGNRVGAVGLCITGGFAYEQLLCLSGGGIRSATFALGVMQGLARFGLLNQFHYLSSVSGGGYIASWLSRWRQSASDTQVLEALNQSARKGFEAPQIAGIRADSNYITPQLGFLSADTWTEEDGVSAMSISRSTALVVLILALAGCAPFDWYRKNTEVCPRTDAVTLASECRQNAVQVLQPKTADDPGYSLGFIEFDDQGQLWSRDQMSAVMKSVSAAAPEATSDFLLVVYVHGWKHNAGWNEHSGEDDPDVTHFRTALKELSATEIELSRRSERNGVSRPPRKVVGVFMGWRGASITVPVIENLTFWDRKSTAHKVGHGEVTEALDRLEEIRLDKIRRRAQLDNGDSRSRLIVVGHSFGGAVVFSALEQILESKFVHSAGTTAAPAEGFGNLVVLLNPAFEAQLYSPLSDMTAVRKSYVEKQLPVLAILTSEADHATGVAFPIGRWFDTRFEKQRVVTRTNPATGLEESISQKSADVRTVGHFQPYETHTLRGTAAASGDMTAKNAAEIGRHNAELLGKASEDWENDTPGNVITFPGSVLTRTQNSVGRNPYLVVNVDKNLIADHNDIWGDGTRQFITNLILISSQSDNLQERKMRRDAIKK